MKPLCDVSAAVSIQSTNLKIFTGEEINIDTAAVITPEGAARQKSFDLSSEMFCHKASRRTYVCQTTELQHGNRTKSKFIFSFMTIIYYPAKVGERGLE